VAAPVWDGSEKVVATVGVSFITSFVSSQELDYIIESVKEAARKIEQQLPAMMSPRLSNVGV
jgi:DNA-binding IclR family transcriptional regulator